MEINNHWLTSAKRITSPNCDNRDDEKDISLIVIHCISLPEGKFNTPYIEQLFTNHLLAQSHSSFAEICQLQVSSHIVIQRGGLITQYVPFNKRAWHAGLSEYQGRQKCNDFSIGIELEGTDCTPYTDPQYSQLSTLIKCLIQTYPRLNVENISGHSDIAPQRKTDPGKYFDWRRLNTEVRL
ncbi:MAG: 1,6-anhydro-N-acetylmuramyl-L-alanine amidase AmpD [Methyloprofundus sp.]|nr:1,6-anhydro-N-acetylmuramyl-L-alanine amidase AmpD [Methyloprofundus sp.]